MEARRVYSVEDKKRLIAEIDALRAQGVTIDVASELRPGFESEVRGSAHSPAKTKRA